MIIYKATNKINGKYYIGKTKKTLDERKKQHKQGSVYIKNKYFYNAINKYGFDNFNWETIDIALTEHELNQKEIYHIIVTSACFYYGLGYNISSGGDGGDTISNHPDKIDIVNRISESLKGRIITKEHRKNISESLKGRIITKEHRKNISESLKNNYEISVYVIEKIKTDWENNKFTIDEIKKKYKISFEKFKEIQQKYKFKIRTFRYCKQRTGIKISIDNIVYNSISDASRKLNINNNTIKYRLKSNNFKEYKYNI